MADLTGTDRGQLVLLAAVVLATLFVALALLLNAVIFAGASATGDGESRVVEDVARYRAGAADAVGSLLATLNARHDDYATLDAELADGIESWENLTAHHGAATGRLVTISVAGTTDGAAVAQSNASRTLTSATGAANWTLVDDAGAVRDFHLVLDRGSLADADGSDDTLAALSNATAFRVAAGGTTVYVYQDGSSDVLVRVGNGTGLSAACRAAEDADGNVTVNLTAGTVGGAACSPLADVDWTAGPFDLRFRHGDAAVGTYGFVAAADAGTVDDGDYATSAADGPTVSPALYAATVSLRYTAPDTHYAGTVRVVPGGAR